MKFALVQYISKNGHAHHFISDIIRLIYLSLLDLGHECSISANQRVPGSINILFSWVQLTHEEIEQWVNSDTPYILFQPEILHETGLNDVKSHNWAEYMPHMWHLFAHALRIWELFDFNLPILQRRELPVDIFPLGYHPKLDSYLPTQPEYDAIFFGSHSQYRADIFQALEKVNISLHTLNFAPNLFRDDLLRKSNVSLNIPLNVDEMFHVSPNRVTAGLYHQVPTLSPQCRCALWLKPMIRMLDTDNIAEEIARYIKEKQYIQDAKDFRQHFIQHPMCDSLRDKVAKL